MRVLLIITATLVLCACDDTSRTSPLQSTKEGLFFVGWAGDLFQVVDGKLVKIEKAKRADQAPRSIQIQEAIPDVTNSGFPVLGTGVAKFEAGIQKTKLTLALGPAGERKVTRADTAKFIDGLRDGTERLKGLTLAYYDSEGFVASSEKTAVIPGPEWRLIVENDGNLSSYEYQSRE